MLSVPLILNAVLDDVAAKYMEGDPKPKREQRSRRAGNQSADQSRNRVPGNGADGVLDGRLRRLESLLYWLLQRIEHLTDMIEVRVGRLGEDVVQDLQRLRVQGCGICSLKSQRSQQSNR